MKRFDIIDIAGIKEATNERLIEVEAEAIKAAEQKVIRNDEDIQTKRWYEHVAFKCDYELKQRGVRETPEWEQWFL